ncbi:MAG: ATP-binding protein [candidate division KSB1 bacterium]|nr:ATP-binding protein [candidate division KSB1 bacterium]MDZ7301437.1 ATP-binding protein [candidate division KSB1 bacterium]MDZ7313469.1 ATP-binding protein [candidate division KSB1 bacterium]
MPVEHIKFRHRLFTRLLISHILLVSIPLLITGRILMHTAQTAIERTILARNLEFARRSAGTISNTLGKAREILRFSAQIPTIAKMERMSQDLMINNMVTQFPIFRRLSLIDRRGRVSSSTAYGTSAFNPEANRMLPVILRNQSYASDVNLSPDNLPIMEIAEPITVHNEVIGALWGEVDLKAIWDVVDSNAIGKYGEAFIFHPGKNGQFIAHTNRRMVWEQRNFAERDIIDSVAAGRHNHKIYINQDGIEMIAAYAPIPQEHWGTVIQQPTSEAFAPAKQMQRQVYLLVLVSVVVAAFIAAVYTRQIVKPVNRLVSGIALIATGNLHHRIPPLGQDEISQLAGHINAMAGRLLEVQRQLKRSERLETLNKLASVLSHEIRNPLNSMVINMQLMRREFSKPRVDVRKLEMYHQIIASEIGRVEALVSNFLLIAKPPKLEKSPQNLSVLLDELIKAELSNALTKGIRVERNYKAPHLVAEADSQKLYQAFLNIFLNAIQAMPGGGRLTIGLDVLAPDTGDDYARVNEQGGDVHYAAISFQDTGKGIPENELSKIFDFYYTTKEQGTGIGLSFAQQIVEEHGGRIQVKSEVGKGSEFVIYLPYVTEKK